MKYLLLILFLLSGCQGHVVKEWKRCQEHFGEPCVVLAAPISKVAACTTAMKNEP